MAGPGRAGFSFINDVTDKAYATDSAFNSLMVIDLSVLETEICNVSSLELPADTFLPPPQRFTQKVLPTC